MAWVPGAISPHPGIHTPSLAFADVDEDGDLDLATGATSGAAKLWLNDGAGVFVDSGMTLFTGAVGELAFADVDCDGDQDLAIGVATEPSANRILKSR